MNTPRRGFTLIELVFILIVTSVVLAVLLPGADQSRMSASVQGSINRLRRINWAAAAYHLDHAGQVPFRGASYSSGMLGAWDTWSLGGKNCNISWGSGQYSTFDESAYARTLNPYLYSDPIPVPTGYRNFGSGSTWTFRPGHPSPPDRLTLQVPVFQSPGDRFSYQNPYGIPNPNRSSYDDVGTSYHLNMIWWSDPTLPGSFTPKYNEGVSRIVQAFDGANPSFIWIGDQFLALAAGSSTPIVGEFGKRNASVVGFADGRAAYIHVVPAATSGPGYTLFP
jgi:competence protein ComGC